MLNPLLIHPQLNHLEQHQNRIERQPHPQTARDPLPIVVPALGGDQPREVLAEMGWPWCERSAGWDWGEEGELGADWGLGDDVLVGCVGEWASGLMLVGWDMAAGRTERSGYSEYPIGGVARR